jgi:peptidoglycan/xylan/chitin deacetylase (PgdA/CDA1 family)
MIRPLIPISKLISLNGLIKASGLPCFFPFYHTVGYKNELPHINKLYEVRTPEEFQKDLELMLKYYHPISPDGLIEGKFRSPGMLISFDDGFTGIKEYAHEILKKKGIPYVVFINPSFIDNKALMCRCKQSLLINHLVNSGMHEILVDAPEISLNNYRPTDKGLDDLAKKVELSFDEFLFTQKPYLSLEDLIQLREEGVYIGAHSMDHPLYEHLSISEQKQQTIDSINWIQENIGTNLKLFSFPFTDHGVSGEFMRWLDTGDHVDLSFGSARFKSSSFQRHFQRLCLEDNRIRLKVFLKSEYIKFMAKRVAGRDKVYYS